MQISILSRLRLFSAFARLSKGCQSNNLDLMIVIFNKRQSRQSQCMYKDRDQIELPSFFLTEIMSIQTINRYLCNNEQRHVTKNQSKLKNNQNWNIKTVIDQGQIVVIVTIFAIWQRLNILNLESIQIYVDLHKLLIQHTIIFQSNTLNILYNLNMGCNQSTSGQDPVMPSSPNRNPLPKANTMHHSPEDFIIIMIGNTTASSLVLGFTKDAFIPIPCRIPIPRYCHSLLHDMTTGYITGGIEDLEANINSKATIDNQILQGTISKKFIKVNMKKLLQQPQNSFQLLPEMINARYAHCVIESNGGLFVLGGRQYGTDENGLLSACQRFDFSSKKWKAIPSMQYPRAAANSILYGEHIYVFGGYSGNNTRTRVIESYSNGDSSWRKLSFSLHEGIEGSVIIKKPKMQNSLIIFGGKSNFGKSNRVVQINFDKSTINYCNHMKQQRSFHKGRVIDGQVILIGGGCEHTQFYSTPNQSSFMSNQPSFLEYCTMKELSSFSQFQEQVSLKFVKKNQGLPLYPHRVCIFGHAFEPFAKIINTDNFVVMSQGQSLSHNFYQFVNVVRVNKQHSFVLGGISPDLADVTNVVYSFGLLNNQIKYLEPMISARYAFATTVLGSYLYVVGGRKLGEDDVAIMNQCERFSFETYKWQPIASLKNRRQSATVVTIGDFILAIGGYVGNGSKSNNIEMYIPAENRWLQLDTHFQLSIQSMTPVLYNNITYMFGGRGDSDIQKVFKLTLDFDEGVKYEKSIKIQLEPVGHLSNPGTNLKVYVNQNGLAYIFGNIPNGIDVYDLKKHKITETQQLTVFQKLIDPLFQAYTLIY